MRFVCPAISILVLSMLGGAPAAVGQQVVVPANMNVGSEVTITLPLSLSVGAPSGGVTVTLTSSNPSIASVWPPSLVIPMEMTTPPRLVTTLTGHAGGTATISAAAPGYTTGNVKVQVGGSAGTPPPAAGGTITLTPANAAVTAGTVQYFTVALSSAAPAGGVVINLSSSDSSVAQVAYGITVPASQTSTMFSVTGVAAGSAAITASSPNFTSASANIVVSRTGGGGSGTSGILIPATLTMVPGDIKEYPIQLAAPAPANGVSLTLTSNNTNKVTLSQTSVVIPGGMTSSPRQMTTVYGLGAGSATITVSAPGYADAATQVQVTGNTPTPGGGTMSFSPTSVSLTGTESKILTLTLSSPAGSAGLAVNLSSSNNSVATVPSSVTFGAGTATYSVPVTGIAAGSTTITATASNYGSAAFNVTVTAGSPPTPPPANGGTITLPSTMSLYIGDIVSFPVTLASAAGSGGVAVTLSNSDSSKAVVSQSTLTIPEGALFSRRDQITLQALAAGTLTITASAPGYTSATTQVTIRNSATGGVMSLSPATASVITGATQNLALNLTGTFPQNALVVYLTSSDTSVATVPVSVSYPPNSAGVNVPVTAVGSGTATITATGSNFGNAKAVITVSATPQINLPPNVSLAVGETVTFPVTLSSAATSNMTVALTSSDTNRLRVSPSTFPIPAGSTSNPNVTTTVTGFAGGAVTVTATSPGYTMGSRQVTVTVPVTPPGITMGLTPANLAITGYVTQNLTLTFSGASSSERTVTLTSSNQYVATVPATITVPANATTANVPVTAASAGSTMITASATGLQNASAAVTVSAPAVTNTLTLPAGWSLSVGQSSNLQVTINPAPSAPLTLTVKSDSAKVSVTPTITVAAGSTSATVPLNGVAAGSATVSVSASGYIGASTQVQVTAMTGSGAFIPGIVALNAGITQTVSLSLGPIAPSGLTVTFASSDPTVVAAPATTVANSSNVSVSVTGLKGGTATITASVPGYVTTALTVTVMAMDGVSVEWHGICWVEFPDPTTGGVIWRHAMDFLLKAPSPVIVQASLFMTTSDCTGLVDNMNDFDATTPPGHKIQGFTNYPYPYYKTASALFWIGARTADGKCQPGSPCSGCMAYTEKTPMCSAMW